MTRPEILLVHGACHRSASWDPLRAELSARGHPTSTIDLPSAGTDPAAGLYADAQALREIVDGKGPLVVVCHSYGGMVGTEALGGGGNVQQLIYLSAFLLEVGMSLNDSDEHPADAEPGDEEEHWLLSSDGTTIAAADPAALFYNRCTPEVTAAAIAGLVPQNLLSFEQPLTAAAWTSLPTSYIHCLDDRAIPLAKQKRMSRRALRGIEIDADHSPFLSAPSATADALAQLIS